jgi:carboxylesterase type B
MLFLTATKTIGATHSDDMIYLTPRMDDPFNEEESKLSELMVDLWANFITSSSPSGPKKINPIWPKYDKQDESFYEINKQPRVKHDFTLEYTAAIQDLMANSAGKQTGLFSLLLFTAVGLIRFMQ